MLLMPLFIGASTALGIGYFCIDVYRNRRRLAESTAPEADLTCYEVGVLDRANFQTVGQAVSHGGHAVGEAANECVNSGIGHYLEVAAHALFPH